MKSAFKKMSTKHWGVDLPIALIYPNEFRVGMGNLGYQFVYHYLQNLENTIVERFFASESASNTKSYESGRPLRDFQVIAFSLPFENDYPAIPRMLLNNCIAPFSQDRTEADPFVIAGGVSVSMNPEPVAPFLDLIQIGELPIESKQNLLTLVAELLRDSIRPLRSEILDMCKGLSGVYVPAAYSFHFAESGSISEIKPKEGYPRIVRAVKRRSEFDLVPVSVMFSKEAEFGENTLIEVNRGCGRGCRFCAGGWIHNPVRYAAFHVFREQVDEAIVSGRTIGLIGSDLAGHPELEEILGYIISKGGKFSLSSIRPEGLTPGIIKLLAATGQKTATLAPETAGIRMKKVIGKTISSERFLELTARLVEAGIPNVRYYFMIGLPTEEDSDIPALIDFVKNAQTVFVEASRSKGVIGKIGVQINPFVPKPWTPFQWSAMPPGKIIQKRFDMIRKELSRISNLTLRMESYKTAYFQSYISRADRRIAKTLLQVAQADGRWSPVLKKADPHPDFFALRERKPDEIFPWDVVSHGPSKAALRKIYENALQETD